MSAAWSLYGCTDVTKPDADVLMTRKTDGTFTNAPDSRRG